MERRSLKLELKCLLAFVLWPFTSATPVRVPWFCALRWVCYQRSGCMYVVSLVMHIKVTVQPDSKSGVRQQQTQEMSPKTCKVVFPTSLMCIVSLRCMLFTTADCSAILTLPHEFAVSLHFYGLRFWYFNSSCIFAGDACQITLDATWGTWPPD